jgi:hypothetical protein
MDGKDCSKCKEFKELENFSVRDGKHISICKQCNNVITKESKQRIRQKKRQALIDAGQILIPENPENKVCKYCKTEKNKDDFRHNRLKCLSCEQKDGREYRRSDYGKEKTKTWVNNNPERVIELSAESFQRNKIKIYARNSLRYKTETKYRVRVDHKNNLLSVYNSYIRSGKIWKVKHLGCDIEFFVKWIKFCFDDKMTLENHGSYWHFDHVIPVNLWDLENESDIAQCFNWANISPFHKRNNMSKHDIVNQGQLLKHICKLNDFIDNHIFRNSLKSNINSLKQIEYTLNKNTISIQKKCARHLTMTGTPLEL